MVRALPSHGRGQRFVSSLAHSTLRRSIGLWGRAEAAEKFGPEVEKYAQAARRVKEAGFGQGLSVRGSEAP